MMRGEVIELVEAVHELLNNCWKITDSTLGWNAWPDEYGLLAALTDWQPPTEESPS